MEENNNAEQTTASSDPGTQEKAPAVASPQGAENAKKIEVTIPQNPTSEGTKETQRNVEAELGKIQKLQKEVNDLRQGRQDLDKKAKAFERINTVLGGDPNAYEAFRKSLKQQTGEDLGSYQEQFRRSTGVSPTGTNIPTQQVTPQAQQTQISNQDNISANAGNVGQSVDVNAIGDIIEQRLDARDQKNVRKMETNTALESLMKANPSLDYRQMKDDAKVLEAQNKLKDILQSAAGLQAANPNLTMSEAVERGYRSLPESWNSTINEARQTGELAGKAKAYGSNVGAESGITGGSGTQSTGSFKVDMLPEDKEMYERMALTSPSAAKHFAASIAGKK